MTSFIPLYKRIQESIRADFLAGRGSESARLPTERALQARYADISEFVDRKVAGLRVYASQVPQLFHSDQGMLDDVAG